MDGSIVTHYAILRRHLYTPDAINIAICRLHQCDADAAISGRQKVAPGARHIECVAVQVVCCLMYDLGLAPEQCLHRLLCIRTVLSFLSFSMDPRGVVPWPILRARTSTRSNRSQKHHVIQLHNYSRVIPNCQQMFLLKRDHLIMTNFRNAFECANVCRRIPNDVTTAFLCMSAIEGYVFSIYCPTVPLFSRTFRKSKNLSSPNASWSNYDFMYCSPSKSFKVLRPYFEPGVVKFGAQQI